MFLLIKIVWNSRLSALVSSSRIGRPVRATRREIGLTPSKPVVLIVEDEPIIRLGAVDLIANAGFEVIEALDADHAIEILNSRDDIRIVVTDIEMPGSMDGLKLAAAVRDRWPPIEIIVTSGKARPPAEALPERGVFVPKPYDESNLVRALREFAR